MGAALWRLGGQLMATVVTKATFSFEDPERIRQTRPDPVRSADEHRGGHPMRSVVGASELAPQLHRADVTLVGKARSAQPVARHPVRMAIAATTGAVLDKTLLVVGERSAGGEPRPFTEMPIDWEHAYGGIGHAENPLGMGYGVATALLPNVIGMDEQVNQTLGFGPVPASFPARRCLLDQVARKQVAQPVMEIPPGIDWRFFQAAPPDQQLPALHGTEWVALDGFCTTHPQLRFRLPGGVALTRVYGAEQAGVPNQVPLSLDMLHLDTEAKRFALVWRGSFPLPDAAADRVVVAATYQPVAEPFEWPSADRLELLPHESVGEGPAPSQDFSGTLVVELADSASATKTLPFAGESPPPPAASRDLKDHDLSGTMALMDEPSAADVPLFGTVAMTGPAPSGDALPFPGAPGSERSGKAAAVIPGAPWAKMAPPRPLVMPRAAKRTLAANDPAFDEARQRAALQAKTEEMEAKIAAKAAGEAAARKAEEQAAAEAAAREAEEAAAKERAKAEAEARREQEAEKFRLEQERARAEQKQREREEAEKKSDAAKQLRANMYGGFKRKR